MKKVFIAAALAAMIVSCGSKGNKSAEIIAESESDSIFAVNDSTLSELQTYSYEGILPAADAEGIIISICNRLLLNILQVISQKYGLNL